MKRKVPQTDPHQSEFNFDAVRLEPDLQLQVAVMRPDERRELAATFLRWHHQLLVSALVLEKQRAPWKRRSLPKLSRQLLSWN